MDFTCSRILVACCVGAVTLLGACFKDTGDGSSGDGSSGDDGGDTGPGDGGDDGETGTGGGGSSGDTGGGTGGTTGGGTGNTTGGGTGNTTGGGTGGTTGGGTGGTTGGLPLFHCEPNAEPTDEINPDERKEIEGDNGTFIDECDDNGDLVEYICEVETECDPPPNPPCETYQTGNVIPFEFDCDGMCVDGTCVARCPDFGDMLEYIEVGPFVMFQNLTDNRVYGCDLTHDQNSDSYDCANDPAVGDQTVVSSLGLQTQWCTGGEFGHIGTGEPQQCTYLCSIVP